MKLYATTKSERASKGQGGNEFLEIIVKAEKLKGIPTRANLYRLTLRNDDGELYADLLDFSIGETIILTDKGAKPCGCEKDAYTCREHAQNDKAKKQKGECSHNWHATHDGQESPVYTKCVKCGAVRND